MSRLTRAVRSVVYPERRLVAQRTLEVVASREIDDATFVGVLPPAGPSYAVSREVATLLARLVVGGQCRSVVELGAGSSSRVLAHALRCIGGGQLTSVEQSPEWCRDAWRDVAAARGVDAELVIASPELRAGRGGIYHTYASAWRTLAARGRYDLVFVDAPQWYYGRDGALPLLHRLLKPGALIVVDDAGRSQERWTIRRWLQTYRGLELLAFDASFGRNGVAVLHFTGDQRVRMSVAAWMSSVVHLAAAWAIRRARGLQAIAPSRARVAELATRPHLENRGARI